MTIFKTFYNKCLKVVLLEPAKLIKVTPIGVRFYLKLYLANAHAHIKDSSVFNRFSVFVWAAVNVQSNTQRVVAEFFFFKKTD